MLAYMSFADIFNHIMTRKLYYLVKEVGMIINMIVMVLAMVFKASLTAAAFDIIMWTCIIMEFIGIYIVINAVKYMIKKVI